MHSRFHPASLVTRLLSTYWFVPSLVTFAAAAAGEVLVFLDRTYAADSSWLAWAYGGGADGARALLSAVAGSVITVVSVTFSVLVVALTVSSQHFGPHLLANFMRDTPAQLVLGTFTGAFAYCLVVLRTVQGDGGDRYAFFVPHLAVSGAVILTLFSVGMLIYYVHHVARSMQVSEITAGVARDFERTVERLYPEPIGEGSPPPRPGILEPPDAALHLPAARTGYIQEIDGSAIVDLASRLQTTVWLLRRPGDFVIAGDAIAAVHPPRDGPRLSAALERAYTIGTERTSRQDAAFAVQQLVEVALRALSPAVNEAFTALTCVDRLGQGLTMLARRKIPSPVRTDEQGATRAIAQPRTFEELVAAAFEPIGLFAGRNAEVSGRVLETLGRLAAIAIRPEDRRAIARVAVMVFEVGTEGAATEQHRAQLADRYDQVRRNLAPRDDAAAPRHEAVRPPFRSRA